MRRTIGNVKESERLYLLKSGNQLEEQSQNAHSIVKSQATKDLKLVLISSNESVVIVWHFRLGHPSFMSLEKLFPPLSIKKNSNSFQCEIYQLSKHILNSYLIQPFKASHPFSVIHGNIWEPY